MDRRRHEENSCRWSRCIALICCFWALQIAGNGAQSPRLSNTIAPPSPFPQMPPRPLSPVELFRHWLSSTPQERAQALAGKSENQKNIILTKLREYDSLSSEEREARLQAMQLHWYLRPLMEIPSTQRAPKLASIPDLDRKLVEERLRQWDLLPPALQKELLDSELSIEYFSRLEDLKPDRRGTLLQPDIPESRKTLEDKLAPWRALPPARRQKMYRQFQQFFELPRQEKEKTLETLSEAERREMEKTLETFEKLPATERARCIESFHRFANMSSDERAQFLKSAERWQAMTPRERATWRSLVKALPPLPPGFARPPLPPDFKLPAAAQAASNSPPPSPGLPK